MLITLNQKEIEKMILTGLADMGIPHEGATINMVAGRSPTGITAEIKLMPREVRDVSKIDDYVKTPVDAVEDSPEKKEPDLEPMDVGDDSEPEDDTSLFDK